MSELDKRAEAYCDAHRCHLQMTCHATAYKAGALEVLKMAEEWLRADPECSAHVNNSAWLLFDDLKAKLRGRE